MSRNVDYDLASAEDADVSNVPRASINLGDSGTSNKGITWFGSSYVGPGNLLCDSEGHFNGNALPTSDIDKVAFQHDADYFNTTDVSKDHIWELDKKAIKGALAVSDPYLGNVATVVGLVAKRGLDLADHWLTGSETALYPNKPNRSGVYFDTSPYLNKSGVEEDPDLDWSYDGGRNPNTSSPSSSQPQHVEPNRPASPAEYWTGGTDTMATSSSGYKRPADSSGGGGPASKKSAGVALPGTGDASDGDPDTGNPSAENAVIPRPVGDAGGYTMVFRKVHTFISYGCAWKVLKYNNTPGAYLGTTSLMNIPVDQPWFYMSPSEFSLLPRGALCTGVRVHGVMRNPRTAFETNSSTSSLATLNQNKFMVKADALNLKTRGINRKLTFGNNSEPMDVTDTTHDQADLKEFIKKLYGQSIDGVFAVSDGFNLPASYMNLPLMYNSYFCNFVNTNHNLGRMGWERFNEKITKVDASFTVGTTVVSYDYKPKCGLLTQQHDPFFDGLVSVQEPNTGDFHMFGMAGEQLNYQDEVDAASGVLQRKSDQKLTAAGASTWKRIFNGERYYTNIDLGQYFRKMAGQTHSSSVQPSCHVGIYPVHKLTTATNSIVPVNFTDVECTWDFETEMTVTFGCPASRTAFDRYHVEYEQSWLASEDHYNQNCFNRGDLSIVNGKYVCPDKVRSTQTTSTSITKETVIDPRNSKNISDIARDVLAAEGSVTPTAAPARVGTSTSTDTSSVELTTSTPTMSTKYYSTKDPNKVLYDYVHRSSEEMEAADFVRLYGLQDQVDLTTTPPTIPSTVLSQVDELYMNPHWWPTPDQFQTYSLFLRYCHDLTVYRRSMNIPIVDEPVDFLKK